MGRPLTVICVGDVFGEPGRRAVQLLLPKLRKQHDALGADILNRPDAHPPSTR